MADPLTIVIFITPASGLYFLGHPVASWHPRPTARSLVVRMLLRPATVALPVIEPPDVDTVCEVFTDAFIRAAGTAPPC